MCRAICDNDAQGDALALRVELANMQFDARELG
jgi:hypothetical protein